MTPTPETDMMETPVRLRRGSLVAFAVPITGANPVVSASNKRRALRFVSDGTNSIKLSPVISMPANQTVTIFTTQPQLELDWETWGSLIQGAWWAQAVTAPVNLAIFEAQEE